jgi:HD-GYP domain-containing protein (c-di-GMP phosphodiesterase class II)
MEILTAQLVAAVSRSNLYPPNHPTLIQAVQSCLTALRELTEATHAPSVTYVRIGDDLLFNDAVIRKSTLPVSEFTALMQRRGVERITIANGVTVDEAQRFIRALAAGEPLQSTANITVGHARVVLKDEPQQTQHRKLSVNQVEVVREEWARYRVERKLRIDQLEELVWSFIDTLAQNTRSMLPLAPLKSHDEYTFVHSVNVALLVLAQARMLGIWGPMLHDFGIAALFHDFGKLKTPPEVLNKPGKLDPREWEIVKSHAAQGSWELTQMAGTSPLAIVVAYEHHLRYDGVANYPLLRSTRTPTLASRMTAIADCYDAITTARPYREPVARAAALEILKLRSGTFFEPQLVANFATIVSQTVT